MQTMTYAELKDLLAEKGLSHDDAWISTIANRAAYGWFRTPNGAVSIEGTVYATWDRKPYSLDAVWQECKPKGE